MSKPKKYLEEIKNLGFTHETLRIKKNDVVEYFVAKHNQTTYNSLYQDVQRFFILSIQEVDVESPSLYQNQSFSYRFREAGMYNISCLNYPRMHQTVIVEGSEGTATSITDLGCSDVTSQVSLTVKDSIFKQSEIMGMECLNQSMDQEFDNISECLHLIKEGCPAFSIKSKFTELFEDNDDNTLDGVLGELHEGGKAPKDRDIISDKKMTKASLAVVNDEGEDLYRVHQLNKLTPNNLFVLLTKLKTKYVKEEEDEKDRTFTSFDDLALYCKNTHNRSPPKSTFDNKAVINRALANIQRRFN